MKRTFLYTVGIVAAIAIAAFVVVGCDGDYGERSDKMDEFLDKFHYNQKNVKKFRVTYDGNGATGGEAPIDENMYDSGSAVRIKDQGTLKNGYATFSGWASNPDGSGISCTKDFPYTITSNITFYAQWDTSKTYTVTVDCKLAGAYVTGSRDYKPGDPVRITAEAPSDDWVFQKWTTESKGVSFVDETNATTSFLMPSNKVTILATFVASRGDVGSLTDRRDDKIYRTVTILQQTWMAQNLDYLNDMTETDSSWCYDNDPDNCTTYGRLYNWDAAMKVCPAGWRLPDTLDWNRLVVAVGGYEVAGKKLKATHGWNDYQGRSGTGTDNYGFSALPGSGGGEGGYYFGGNNGNGGVGENGYWWTTTMWTATWNPVPNSYHFISMYYFVDLVENGARDKGAGQSVRCIKND
jgi:uncharacterized protein (TIGR02145 family)